MKRPSLLLGVLLTLLACSSDHDSGSCSDRSDCPSGMLCIDELCVDAADASLDGATDAGSDSGYCPAANRCGDACCGDTQECIDSMCLDACSSEVRCGPEYTCCATGDLCVADACVTPGATCVETIDCGLEAYCDEELGRCLPRLAGRCEYFPPAGDFAPVEEWHWDSSAIAPTSLQVMMTPVVGDIDGDGTPEVVAMTYNPTSSYGGQGVLRVVDGATGAEELSITEPTLCGDAGIALGDLDGDGTPEIVTGADPCGSGGIVAFAPDGTLLWTGRDGAGNTVPVGMDFGAPAIADLEGDGQAEVIVGGIVFESNGTLRFNNGKAGYNCCGSNARSMLTTAYDVDDDPELEIVAPRAVWNHDGSVVRENDTLPEGFLAVADFFDDGAPDIVVVHGNSGTGAVSILRGDSGALLWGPVTIPGGGRGGPPTVADFDGDGLPEIGVAGATSYSVYDPDGDTEVLWSTTTQDTSSNITGSSVFDFDGDGRAEVVYNDECYMRIYAGPTGEVLRAVPQNSHTLIEYPLIVDVDGDGNAEIVFAANNAVNRCAGEGGSWDGAQAGIRAFGDALDNWVSTRTVWNQHAYSITHIREDLSVPTTVVPNHELYNSFRQNPQSFDAPDLVASAPAVDLGSCPATITLRVRVENQGAISVGPGLPVAFYVGERLVGVARTTGRLVPGGGEEVELTFTPEASELNVDLSWHVVVDFDGTSGEQNECDEENNRADATTRCEQIG